MILIGRFMMSNKVDTARLIQHYSVVRCVSAVCCSSQNWKILSYYESNYHFAYSTKLVFVLEWQIYIEMNCHSNLKFYASFQCWIAQFFYGFWLKILWCTILWIIEHQSLAIPRLNWKRPIQIVHGYDSPDPSLNHYLVFSSCLCGIVTQDSHGQMRSYIR